MKWKSWLSRKGVFELPIWGREGFFRVSGDPKRSTRVGKVRNGHVENGLAPFPQSGAVIEEVVIRYLINEEVKLELVGIRFEFWWSSIGRDAESSHDFFDFSGIEDKGDDTHLCSAFEAEKWVELKEGFHALLPGGRRRGERFWEL